MKYTSESFDSLSSAYDNLAEQHGIDFDSFLHDKRDTGAYDVEVCQTHSNIIVGCLKLDFNPLEFFENDHIDGIFKHFVDFYSRDEYLATLKKSSLFYLVDRYEHGSVHYSVSNTHNYPDKKWDVSHGCAVYVPSEYIQEEYIKAKKKMSVAQAKEKFIKEANSTLDSYSDYCNGEVYGYSVVTYNKEGKILNEEESWGLIGNKNANDEKINIMKSEFDNSIVNELLKEVEIITFNDNQIPNISQEVLEKIHKNVDFDNVASGKYTEVYGEKILTVIHKTENKAFVYHDNGIDKPFVAHFEKWQKEQGVSVKQFSESRFLSDIKEVIRKNLSHDNKKTLNLNNN